MCILSGFSIGSRTQIIVREGASRAHEHGSARFTRRASRHTVAAARISHMNEEDSQNTLDTHEPKAEALNRLSETEKKEIEVGGLMEHAHGGDREDLHDQVRRLDAESPDS